MSRQRSYLIPVGAILTLICFFFPWVKASTMGLGLVTMSGAKVGGLFWLVPICAVLVLAVYVIFLGVRQLGKAKSLLLVLSLAALVALILKFITIASADQPFWTTIAVKAVKVSFKWGIWDTLAGILIMLLGALRLKPKTFERAVVMPIKN